MLRRAWPRVCAASAAACAAAALGVYSRAQGIEKAKPDRLSRWEARWASGQTRWHLPYVHPVLKRYLSILLPEESTATQPAVLFPLCGTSTDMGVLALRGHRVIGVEGVPLAVDQLLGTFGDEEPVRHRLPGLALRTSATEGAQGERIGIEVIEGDFLGLSAESLRTLGLSLVEAVFDRGSLVAVTPQDRQAYCKVLSELVKPGGRILLVSVEHDAFPDGRLGPPFQVKEYEIRQLFPGFDVRFLHREDKSAEFRERGLSHFFEVAFLLTKRTNAAQLQSELEARLQDAALHALSKGEMSLEIANVRVTGPPRVTNVQVRG